MLQTVEQFKVESNIGGKRIAMRIADDARHIVMDVLSGMYSNPVLAMIREYSTNAWDAHVESGQTKPIEVTLPSALSPFLKVKDYGTGLELDDIEAIYSAYGASTKRETNTQNGTFGIGCKAALAYCSQFTVTSVKDGTKIIVNVGRDEDGAGTMTVLDPVPTSEPNGTEVTIPAARGDIERMRVEAEGFFRFWKPGTVKVNGKEPVPFKGLKMTDNIFVLENDRAASVIVMGNVAYPVPELNSLVPSASVVAFVPIGAVRIPPARESLMDTKSTRATIERIRREFQDGVKSAIQRDVEAAPSHSAAIQIVTRWNEYVGKGAGKPSEYVYKGDSLPEMMHMPAYNAAQPAYRQSPEAVMQVSAVGSYRARDTLSEIGIAVNLWPTTVWVTNFAPEKFTTTHKNKLLKWCRENDLVAKRFYKHDPVRPDVERFVMTRCGLPDTPFIDKRKVVAWEDVRKVKLDPVVWNNNSGELRIPGSYDIYTEVGFKAGVPGNAIRQRYPIFFNEGNRAASEHLHDTLKMHVPNYTLVCLARNRVGKFQRILPQAQNARVALKAKYDAWLAGLSDDEKKAYAMDSNERTFLLLMDAGKLNDPAMHEAIRLANMDVSKIQKGEQSFRFIAPRGLGVTWTSPLGAYLLIEVDRYSPTRRLLRTDPQHVYNYMNAAYAARLLEVPSS